MLDSFAGSSSCIMSYLIVYDQFHFAADSAAYNAHNRTKDHATMISICIDHASVLAVILSIAL